MEINARTTLTISYTEQEFAIANKALALMAGLPGAPSKVPSDEERAAAAELNRKALEQQYAVYVQKMRHIEQKLAYAQDPEVK